jgi:hypothetical protein
LSPLRGVKRAARWSPAAVGLAVVLALSWGAAAAGAGHESPSSGRDAGTLGAAPREGGTSDGGVLTAAAKLPELDAGTRSAVLTTEDREVIENLELLENLDESRDVDLLLDLFDESKGETE